METTKHILLYVKKAASTCLDKVTPLPNSKTNLIHRFIVTTNDGNLIASLLSTFTLLQCNIYICERPWWWIETGW